MNHIDIINSFKEMKWDRDYSRPSKEVISCALDLINSLSISPKYIAPSVEEGIGFTFIKQDKYAYIEILNCREILFLIDTNGDNRQVWAAKFSEVQLIMNSLIKVEEHLN